MNRIDTATLVLLAALSVPAALAARQTLKREEVPRTPVTPALQEPVPPACPVLEVPFPELISIPVLDRPVPPLEGADRLAPFYERMARLLRGNAKDHLRIGFYSDSNGCKDFLSGELRRFLQLRYGDAGHGWIGLGRPWSWYIHRDIRHGLDEHLWTSYVVSSLAAPDPYYGHGLIAAETKNKGARTWVGTAPASSRIGKTVSRVEAYYLRRPHSGSFDVLVDGAKIATVATEGTRIEPGYFSFEVPDAPHKVTFVADGRGPVRLLGATLERGAPSIVVDAIGIGGMAWRTWLREDRELDEAMLRHRNYDLFIVHVGTNSWRKELGREEQTRTILGRLRKALPEASMLVMSPGDNQDDPRLIAEELVFEQRRIANDVGAAYFDFHAAMGGKGTVGPYTQRGLTEGDGVHLNEAGGAYLGRRVLLAFFRGFVEWLRAHPEAGCK
jgi:lysophospholipase L1-like esterase